MTSAGGWLGVPSLDTELLSMGVTPLLPWELASLIGDCDRRDDADDLELSELLDRCDRLLTEATEVVFSSKSDTFGSLKEGKSSECNVLVHLTSYYYSFDHFMTNVMQLNWNSVKERIFHSTLFVLLLRHLLPLIYINKALRIMVTTTCLVPSLSQRQ